MAYGQEISLSRLPQFFRDGWVFVRPDRSAKNSLGIFSDISKRPSRNAGVCADDCGLLFRQSCHCLSPSVCCLLTLPDKCTTIKGQYQHGIEKMPKIEIRVTDAEKATIQRAADASQLRLATWVKARVLLDAIEVHKGGKQ
jgi:hypothetical protein